MDGSTIGHDGLGRFTNGNSEYRARKARVAERLRQLSLDLDPSPSQQQLLPIIAKHLDDAEYGRPAERRIRASNTVRRLMRDLKRKPSPAVDDQAAQALALLSNKKPPDGEPT
jgi:hypothetical protein